MTTNEDWIGRVGASWAENHRLTDRALSGLTDRLLDAIRPLGGRRILDIGCGAGELSLALSRERPSSKVVGLDISPDLVAVARERGSNRDNLEFAIADAQTWRAGEFDPDLIVSRHGVMFFPDPVAAFSNLRQGADDRAAKLCFSCFRAPDLNPWASEIASMFDRPQQADIDEPGPFAFASRDAVHAMLEQAGWQAIEHRAVDFAFVAGMGPNALDDALDFFTRIGPGARAIAEREGAEREAALLRLRDWLSRRRHGHLVALPAAAWIVMARV
jgi:SAM-dependent methyltransferase